MVNSYFQEKAQSSFPVFSERIEEGLHILWQGGLEGHYLAGCGVFEFETVGVQGDTVYDRLFDGRFGIGQLPGIDKFPTVRLVGDNGVLYIG
jgi:hypothetical protein